MSEYAQSLGISITTHTETCCEYPVTSNIMHLYTGEEQVDKCMNCYEDKEERDDAIAYEIVDEGNMQYKHQWSRTDDQPSGSDWTASETYIKPQSWVARMTEKWDDDNPFHLIELSVQFEKPEEDYLTRHEFSPPIVQLVDGGVLDNLWELEDYTQYKREKQCQWCNILTPKMFNDCQSCDKPLENNTK